MLNNEYYLENNTNFTQPLKLVADIAQLYAWKYSEDLSSAKYLIKLQQESEKIIIKILQGTQMLGATEVSLLTIPEHKYKQHVKLALFLELQKLFPEKKIEWGILRGVRPLKLVRNLLEKYQTAQLVNNCLQKSYGLTEKKATLAIAITERQNSLLANYGKQDVAVYIGIPYCNTKCSYCSFPSSLLPEQTEVIEIFLQTIEQDIQNVLQLANEYNLNVACLYIGGGTPTSFLETHFNKFVEILKKYFPISVRREFTFEAGRVDSLSKIKLQQLQELGITRISLNPQTLNKKTLGIIGRGHSLEEFYNWYSYVKNTYKQWLINTDLILGLPGEKVEDVETTLRNLKQLQADNITIHTLAFKKGAQLFSKVDQYYQDNTLQEMSLLASNYMQELQQQPYYLYRQRYILGNLENIGYSLVGRECRYNAMIMSEEFTILGVGPSATTKVVSETNSIETFFMPKNVDIYVQEIKMLLCKRAEIIRACYKKQE